MKKKASVIIISLLGVALLFVGGNYLSKSRQSKFEAPRSEAPEVKYRIIKENALMAVTGNLKHYGFIKDEESLLYALEHTKDEKPGNEGAIKVGNNDINTDSVYTISQAMDAWEIARILLNEGTYSPRNCDHGCEPWHPFTPALLPGGDIAPSLREQLRSKYDWVQSYGSCVEAIGSDGGQLSSEQYYERTGIRECISPDGRVFTEGKEGWSDQPSP